MLEEPISLVGLLYKPQSRESQANLSRQLGLGPCVEDAFHERDFWLYAVHALSSNAILPSLVASQLN